jgi:hypothetical protein
MFTVAALDTHPNTARDRQRGGGGQIASDLLALGAQLVQPSGEHLQPATRCVGGMKEITGDTDAV